MLLRTSLGGHFGRSRPRALGRGHDPGSRGGVQQCIRFASWSAHDHFRKNPIGIRSFCCVRASKRNHCRRDDTTKGLSTPIFDRFLAALLGLVAVAPAAADSATAAMTITGWQAIGTGAIIVNALS